jgi:hypothetical protein
MSRTAQIKSLKENYEAQGNSLVVLCGRDGCDKERLLRVYLQDKKYFYYRARWVSDREQYRQMAAQVEAAYDVRLQQGTYQEIFKRVRSGDASKLVVVIDEFQYIAKKNPEFLDAIEKLRDHKLYPGPVQIILASSDLVYVQEEEALGGLEKKKGLRLVLEGLSFVDLVQTYQNLSLRGLVELYACLGGVSDYVSHWNPKADLRTNICRLLLSKHGYLHGSVERYLSLHLRELSVYETILAAIAAGNRKLNDLYHLTGFSRAKISVYLKHLMEIDVIEKAASMETGGDKNTQKGLYQISDHLTNFWFCFVYPHLSDLYMMAPEEFYDAYIADGMEEYLNRYFVQVCAEYMDLMNQAGKLPLKVTRQGTWIGKQGTIDIVARDEVRNTLVAACNWSKPEMSTQDLRELGKNLQAARLKPQYIFMFTATGFSEELQDRAKERPELIIVDMNEM